MMSARQHAAIGVAVESETQVRAACDHFRSHKLG